MRLYPPARFAVQALDDFGGPLILCDLMMPHMSGMDFHAALERIAPEQAARMVFLTGGAFTARAREFLDTVPAPRVDKPFAVNQMRTLVDERLRVLRARA